MKYNTTKLHLQEPLIRECLSNFDFKKADSIFYSSIEQYLSYDSKIALFAMYEKIRLPYVESFINQKLHLKNPFDSEQIAAIGSVYE